MLATRWLVTLTTIPYVELGACLGDYREDLVPSVTKYLRVDNRGSYWVESRDKATLFTTQADAVAQVLLLPEDDRPRVESILCRFRPMKRRRWFVA